MLPYIHVFGRTVPMYGVCLVIGIFVAGFFMVYDCKRKGLLWEDALIAVVVALGIGFAGAKLLYIAISFTPRELVEIVKQGRLQDILRGGFVFYGGLIFGILGAHIGTKIAGSRMKEYENVLIKTVPLAHGFGRIGCLCAGCCYGKPAAGHFHITFSHPMSDAPVGVPLVPVQIYESVFNFALFFVLLAIDVKYPKNRILLPVYILAYSVERFVMEYFRYDSARGFWLGLSTSQWISAAIFLAGGILLLTRLRSKGQQEIIT